MCILGRRWDWTGASIDRGRDKREIRRQVSERNEW